MKKIFYFLMAAALMLVLAGCPTVKADGGGTTTTLPPLNMALVNVPSNSTGFSMGWAGLAEPVHTVASITTFNMGKYEVTYSQWHLIRIWAEANGYKFANKGMEGSVTGGGTYPAYTNVGKIPTGSAQPVTMVSWRDCVVWCNAASEYEGLKPCYKSVGGEVIKDSTNATVCDNAVLIMTEHGYRLPTEAEWEYAARYKGSDSSNGAVEYPAGSGKYWTPGNYMSGSAAPYTNDSASFAVAVFKTYSSGTAVTPAVTGTAVVGSKSISNALGIYHMSGNVCEWCYDWWGTYITASPYTNADTTGAVSGFDRIYRGGGWGWGAYYCQNSCRFYDGSGSLDPSLVYLDLGFRVVKRTVSQVWGN